MSIETTGAIMQRYWEGHDATAIAEGATFTDIASGQSWAGREAIGGMLDYFYEQVFDARFEPECSYVADELAAVEDRGITEGRVWFMVSSFLQQVSG